MKAIRNQHSLLALLLALLVSCASPTPKPDPAPVEVPEPIISETPEEEESVLVDEAMETPEKLDSPEKDGPTAPPVEKKTDSTPSVSIVVHQVKEKDAQDDATSQAATEENEALTEPASEEISPETIERKALCKKEIHFITQTYIDLVRCLQEL